MMPWGQPLGPTAETYIKDLESENARLLAALTEAQANEEELAGEASDLESQLGAAQRRFYAAEAERDALLKCAWEVRDERDALAEIIETGSEVTTFKIALDRSEAERDAALSRAAEAERQRDAALRYRDDAEKAMLHSPALVAALEREHTLREALAEFVEDSTIAKILAALPVVPPQPKDAESEDVAFDPRLDAHPEQTT